MELTPNEKEFLKTYRRLTAEDKGYIKAVVEDLEKKSAKNSFKVCGKKEADQ